MLFFTSNCRNKHVFKKTIFKNFVAIETNDAIPFDSFTTRITTWREYLLFFLVFFVASGYGIKSTSRGQLL